MIQTLVVDGQDSGILKIPPPILSRVFQTISRGQVNLANCKKMTSTLFPFPYAQLIAVLCAAFSMITPFVMCAVCSDAHWAFIFTLVPVFGIFAMNQVAKELEMPFGEDPNDLPLIEFQEHMNKSLLMLIRPETDHVVHTGDNFARSYDELKCRITCMRPKDFILEGTKLLTGDSTIEISTAPIGSKVPPKAAAPEPPKAAAAAPPPTVPAAPKAPAEPKAGPPNPGPGPVADINGLQKVVDSLAESVATFVENHRQSSEHLRELSLRLKEYSAVAASIYYPKDGLEKGDISNSNAGRPGQEVNGDWQVGPSWQTRNPAMPAMLPLMDPAGGILPMLPSPRAPPGVRPPPLPEPGVQ
jgi:hypothetical protein